jgi:TonB family protein
MRLLGLGTLVGLAASTAIAGPAIRPLITPDDYPARALEAHPQGSVHYAITVGNDGRVVSCEITQTSGDPVIDKRTCDILRKRARFGAEAAGKTIQDQVSWTVYN